MVMYGADRHTYKGERGAKDCGIVAGQDRAAAPSKWAHYTSRRQLGLHIASDSLIGSIAFMPDKSLW